MGTSFTINARDENVKVSVNSGLVEFISPQKQRVKLEKDQEAVYEAEKDTIRAAPITDRNVFAFKTKVFEFNETELSEVVTALNKAYQINIRLGAGDWKNYHLSTRFENEKLEDVLVIVAETFDLSLSHSDSTFTFSKKMNLQ